MPGKGKKKASGGRKTADFDFNRDVAAPAIATLSDKGSCLNLYTSPTSDKLFICTLALRFMHYMGPKPKSVKRLNQEQPAHQRDASFADGDVIGV